MKITIASNPTSGATISGMAHAFRPAVQSGLHASLAGTEAMLVMDSTPSSGATKATPNPPEPKPAFNNIYDYMAYDMSKNSSGAGSSSRNGGKEEREGGIRSIDLGGGMFGGGVRLGGVGSIIINPVGDNFYYTGDELMAAWFGVSTDAFAAWEEACNGDGWYAEYARKAGPRNYLPRDVVSKIISDRWGCMYAHYFDSPGDFSGAPEHVKKYMDAKMKEIIDKLVNELLWTQWGVDSDGKTWLFGYQFYGEQAHLFWGPNTAHGQQGTEYHPYDIVVDDEGYKVDVCYRAWCFAHSWAYASSSGKLVSMHSVNYTGAPIRILLFTVYEELGNGKSVQWVLDITIGPGYTYRTTPYNPRGEGQSFFNFKWYINEGAIQPDGTYFGIGKFGGNGYTYFYWSDTYGNILGFQIIPGP